MPECTPGTAGCSDADAGVPDAGVDPLVAYCPINAAAVEARIDDVLGTLTLQEKASLMHGALLVPVDGTWETIAIPEKGIPGFHMLDGPKGVGGSSVLPNIANGAFTTAFPVSIARAATWDPALERRVGAAMGQEARAVGADVLLAPGMNLAWHPLSGRNQEYYGEDPFLAGEIGVGFVQGVQSMGVVATAKHYTANHIEDTRLEVNVDIDERTLRETFLPQFRKVVQEGAVGSVMSAYNQVNGTYCGENGPLLRDILKGDWQFAGYVVTDFIWGSYNTVPSAIAGLDLEMPYSVFYGQPIVDAVASEALEESNVDDHVRRILRAQLCYELDTAPAVPDETQLETAETIALALEVAAKAITLLRNENDILPLSKTATQSIVLVGPLAALENIGDLKGSSGVKSTEIVTIAEGLLARDDVTATIELIEGDLSAPSDQATVTNADIVLVAVGLTDSEEGEGQVRPPSPELGAGDREIYGIPPEHAALLATARSLNDQVVVLLEGGSAIDVTPWFEDTQAVLMAWYPGVQGGNAVADILFGDANPQGRLPVSFPASLDDLQAFPRNALEVEYDRYHGYQRLDRNGVSPFLPFGFGLSYTRFDYTNLSASTETVEGTESIILAFDVTNAGSRAGVETAQAYAGAREPSVDVPVRKLVGFTQVTLEPGETQSVELSVPVEELAYYDLAEGWVVEPGPYLLEVGHNVADLPLSAQVRR